MPVLLRKVWRAGELRRRPGLPRACPAATSPMTPSPTDVVAACVSTPSWARTRVSGYGLGSFRQWSLRTVRRPS